LCKLVLPVLKSLASEMGWAWSVTNGHANTTLLDGCTSTAILVRNTFWIPVYPFMYDLPLPTETTLSEWSMGVYMSALMWLSNWITATVTQVLKMLICIRNREENAQERSITYEQSIPYTEHGRSRRRWEDNIKMDLQEVGGGVVWTGSSWLRIGTSGGHLWGR
jgi:hypothetical protein